MKTIQIVVVDDHAILRSGLRMLINAQKDMQAVAEASSVAELSRILKQQAVDVVLLDIALPGRSGLQVVRELRESHPSTKVLVLSMHRDVALVRSALADGVAGFVCKEAADVELLTAIRAVQRGGLYLDPALTKLVLVRPPASGSNVLTNRERQVARLIAQGYSNQDSANRLKLSVKTIETFRARIAEKLDLHTRSAIAKYVFASGLLTAEELLRDKWPT
jgi:DNA-binding NarL/FixJ family response regulator